MTRIHLHDHVLDITAKGKVVAVLGIAAGGEAPEIRVPSGWTVERAAGP